METASLLPRTSPPPPSISPENLAVAALHISEALLPAPSNASTLRSFFLPNFSSPLRRRAYIFHSVYLLPLRTILISLLLLLTFLEPPSWCSATGCLQLSLTSPDPANPTLLSPTFQTFPLPPPSLLALLPPIEFVVYLLLLLELSTHAAYVSNPGPLSLFYSTHLFLGSSSLRSSSSRRGGLALPAPTTATTYNHITLFYTSLLLLSFLLYLLPPAISLLLRPYARLLLFIAHNKAVLRELKLILNLLPEVAKILSLEFLIIGIYAWWGTMMFANSSEEGRENFSSWGASVWSLWTLVTTANFPNVMMPAYSKNRAAVIFFSSFLLLAMFLMVNLLLAAVYNNYQEERKGFQKNVQKNALSNLRAAFSVLDVENNGVIYKPQMLLLFTELNEHIAAIKHIPKEKQDVMLSVLDVSGDQEWDLDEFLGFVAVLQIEFESEENLKGLVEHSFPSVYASPTFQAVEAAVLAPSFEYFIDAALILNTLVIMLQNKHELVGDSSSGEMHGGAVVMELIDVVFLVVFVAEVLLRVAVVGWRRYWGSYRFRFDFVVTFLSVFATVLYWLPGQIQEKSVVQTIMMIRLLRLVRLVMAVNAFAVIGDTVTEIIPVCSRMFMVLFCITYLFAVTAVNTLGGAVSIDPAAPSFPALMASDYGTSNFYANNFNDMLGSFVVLFELLVVNNWTVTCDGYEIVTGSKLVRLFFASFHIVGVLIINNLVISFIVDSFSTEYEAEISSRKGEGAGGVGGDSKVHQFDAAALGSGSVSGKWTATVQRGKDGGKRRESLLQSMFRQRKGSAK